MNERRHEPAPPVRTVLYTRGRMQADLAGLLSPEAAAAGPEPVKACIESRADLLVTSRLGSFDLTAVAVPSDFEPESVGHVVAAIGTGPHSTLAAHIAYVIGGVLDVPTEFVTAATEGDRRGARLTLEELTAARPGATWRLVDGPDPSKLLATAPDRCLLIAGAPGGNWFQRQLFGRGARLRAKAPAGTVVVRSAPRRVFHGAETPRLWVAPHLRVEDALEVVDEPVVPVAEGGFLVGVARRSAFRADGIVTVGDVMEPAPAVTLTDPLASVAEVAEFYEGAPIPVIDEDGRLVACVAAKAAA